MPAIPVCTSRFYLCEFVWRKVRKPGVISHTYDWLSNYINSLTLITITYYIL